MGFRDLKERSCTIQYPWDTSLLLDLVDLMTSPVLLLLVIVGSYHTGRFLMNYLYPVCSRLTQSALQSVLGRLRRTRPPRVPTISDPRRERARPEGARPERVRPNCVRPDPSTTAPRLATHETPGTLAILTPARDPPVALVNALNDYQTRAQPKSPKPRARAPRKNPEVP